MQPTTRTVRRETDNFVHACEAIHSLLESEPLPTGDRDVLIITARDLLNELKTLP